MKKLYVGNLSFRMTDAELRSLFEPYGTVESARIVTNPDTGKSRGFALVSMPSEEEAMSAMSGLNGRDSEGRTLTVNQARSNDSRDQ